VAGRPEAEVVIVGAGIVGLAAAAALSRAGRSVLILEREAAVGRGITSRNSEVIHAGIYYPPGSLKARLCTAGREALYARCRKLRLPHRRTGKLIVASEPAEVAILEDLLERGRANGVPDLELLDGATAARLEPAVRAEAALHSPHSGIVDAGALALSFLAEAEAGGAQLLLRTELEAIERRGPVWRVSARTAEGDAESVESAALVNAAGLDADRIAALAGLDVEALGYRLHPCKGDYCSLAPGASLSLSRLVYPVPAGAGLGIHATLDLAGRIRFGPDAEYVSEISYRVAPGKTQRFAEAAGRYLPGLRAEWLSPDMAGVRPKLAGPGEPPRDFVVREESEAGCPGLVSCVGIESPGLTAAPAIGDRVAELLAGL
jgi:L-2-hydroxyglutarate oxidase LhgO